MCHLRYFTSFLRFLESDIVVLPLPVLITQWLSVKDYENRNK